jgi:hypothetical protein
MASGSRCDGLASALIAWALMVMRLNPMKPCWFDLPELLRTFIR